jgi:hypothetical protein
VLAAGQGYRSPGSCQQLRHIGCPDGERGWIHGQPPPAILLTQAGIHGWSGGVQQVGQARDAQVAGSRLVTRGEPGRWPARQGPRPVQLVFGPGDLIPRPMTACTGTGNPPPARARPTTPPSE